MTSDGRFERLNSANSWQSKHACFRAVDKVLAERIESLGGRIESLVSGMGQYIAKQ